MDIDKVSPKAYLQGAFFDFKRGVGHAEILDLV
jgi:hypothetical protein